MSLFRDDESKASDLGNPCKPHFRHVLLLALIRKKYNPTQGILQAIFGVYQMCAQVPQGDGPDTGICSPHG